MNIWMFNENAYAPDMPGGTRHYDFAHELVKLGHDVTIFAKSFHHHRHQELRLNNREIWKIEIINGVRFVWIRTPPYFKNDWRRAWNHIMYTLRIWNLGRKIIFFNTDLQKPDVIIGSSPHLFTPFAAYRLSKSFHVPFIMEIRDLWPQVFIDLNSPLACYPIIKPLQILEKYLYFKSYSLIILGPQMKKHMNSMGLADSKIHWIPNGVNLNPKDTSNQEIKFHSSNKFIIMYLGAHGYNNSMNSLLYTAKIIQDSGFSSISFILIGDGPEKDGLIKISRKLELKNLSFYDPVPKKDVQKFLSQSNVLFVSAKPTFVNSGGSLNKLSDYMAAAKPIIFAIKAEYNPVDESHCGLTIPPENPDAIADAIKHLYYLTDGERNEMGLNGRKFVEEHHDISILVKKLEKILIEAVSR